MSFFLSHIRAIVSDHDFVDDDDDGVRCAKSEMIFLALLLLLLLALLSVGH